MIYRFDICAGKETLSEKILWNSNSDLFTARDGVIHRVAKIHLTAVPRLCRCRSTRVHNDFRGERVRDVIRISPLSKTSSLFFTAAIFQRPFFFLPRCSSNRFRPILSDPSFLIDRETRLLLYLLRLSPSLSLSVSPR